MVVGCPPEVLGALLKRNQSQAALEKGIIQANKKLRIANTMWGIHEETEADHVVTTYHLLQPEESET